MPQPPEDLAGTLPRHHTMVIVFHWLTVVLLAVAVAAVLGHEWSDGGAARQRLLDLHRLIGLGLLAIVPVRAALRRVLGGVASNAALPAPMALLAAVSYGALYLLLLAVPLLGWAQWSASGRAMQLFAIFNVPALIGHDRELAETLAQWHTTVAWLLLSLAGAHAAAALWHHYGRGDSVLGSMLPWLRSGGEARTRSAEVPVGP